MTSHNPPAPAPRALHVLFLTVLVDLIGFGMVIPILPFAAPRFGAGALDIALLLASYSVCGALASPLWGKLSDHWGRKKTLLVCLLGGAAASFSLAFVTELWMLYAARILAGSFSGNFGVASAMAADLSTPQTRARAMGLVGSAFGLGMVVGPSVGGLLAGPEASLAKPGLVAGVLTLVAAIGGLVLLPETVQRRAAGTPPPARETTLELLARTGNTSLVFQFLALTGAITTISYLFPLATGDYLRWGPTEVGIVFGIQGLCMAALQAGLVGRLAQRFGEVRVLRVALTLMIAGFSLSALASTAPWMVAGFFIAVTGASCSTPVLNALLANRTPLPLRGRMLGTSSAAAAWGRVFGPLVAGPVLVQLGYGAAWMIGAVVGATILAWAIQVERQPAGDPASSPADGR